MNTSPKRRRKKDNPYTLLYESDSNKYFVLFKDARGVLNKVEVSNIIYNAFNRFELDDISELHKIDKHIDMNPLDEEKYYKINNESSETNRVIVLPFTFKLLIGRNYIESYNYIPLLLLGMLFNVIVSFIGSIHIALKKTNEIAKTSFLSAIINFVINIFFIKIIGIYAAALSKIVAFLVIAINRYKNIRKYITLDIYYKNILIIIILFVISSINYYYRISILNIIVFIAVFLALIFLNYNDLKKIYYYIINKFPQKNKKNNLYIYLHAFVLRP